MYLDFNVANFWSPLYTKGQQSVTTQLDFEVDYFGKARQQAGISPLITCDPSAIALHCRTEKQQAKLTKARDVRGW